MKRIAAISRVQWGTIARGDIAPRDSWRQRIRMLLAVLGPGRIFMVLRPWRGDRGRSCTVIFERFGGFWGSFRIMDLFVLNALTITTEFIGITLAPGYLGLPKFRVSRLRDWLSFHSEGDSRV